MSWVGALKSLFWLGLAAGGVGYYVRDHVVLSSSYATVAAHTTTFFAHRDGSVQHGLRDFSLVAPGSELLRVVASPEADAELRQVNTELATARAEVASLEELMDFGHGMRGRISNRQLTLTKSRAEHLQRLVAQADSERAVRTASAEGADAAKRRSDALCSEGLLTAVECEAITTRATVSQRELASAEGMLDISRFLLDATRAGRDVGQDMGSEITYARQTSDELKLRLATIQQQLETRRAQVRALEARAMAPATPLILPQLSRVVRVHQPSGAVVVKGEPLLDVADCDRLFVYAIVNQEQYRRLAPGTGARVKTAGRTYDGKIVALFGPFGRSSAGMAPDPPVVVEPRQASSAAVAIEASVLSSEQRASCPVGQAAEVDFSR
jgi:multidrug resistance efflux pump